MSHNAKYLLLAMVMIIVSGCAGVPMPPKNFLAPVPTPASSTSKGSGLSIEVEVDVFSGQPNPKWALSGTEAVDFLKQLESLQAIPAQELDNPLGYRGMLVYVSGAEAADYRIWRGVILKNSSGTTTSYTDHNYAIEKWLLQTGKSHLQDDLFQMISDDIAGRS